jgi:hypothetical protein
MKITTSSTKSGKSSTRMAPRSQSYKTFFASLLTEWMNKLVRLPLESLFFQASLSASPFSLVSLLTIRLGREC